MLDPFAYAKTRLATRPEIPPVAEFRALVARLIGSQHEPFPAPEVVFGETVVEEGYTRQALTFTSREGVTVFAFLLTPTHVSSAGIGVLCLHGHGRGVDPIVGLGEPDTQNGFALRSVRKGYVTLAIEQMSFGRRKSARDVDSDYSCHTDTTAAFMLGETMVGWRVRDARAALSVLAQQPGVNPGRLAVLGMSGGGTTALWTAALDERVAACMINGYFCTFEASILGVFHCVCNYVPSASLHFEMPDLAHLVAPRRLFVESGESDPIFPLPAFRQACAEAKATFAAAGVPENFGCFEFPGGHQFHGDGLFRSLKAAFPAESG